MSGARSAAPSGGAADRALLDALAVRIAAYQGDPRSHRYRLTRYSVGSDPAIGPLYHAARARVGSASVEWWRDCLVRAGMSPAEASLASVGKLFSRDAVLLELEGLYRLAIKAGTWPKIEVVLSGAQRKRARDAFGSLDEARHAVLSKLQLKKPRRDWAWNCRGTLEGDISAALAYRVKNFLPLERQSRELAGASFAEVAAELGIRRWRKQGYPDRSLQQLIFLAAQEGAEVLSRLVRTVVKRAARRRRDRRPKQGWDPSALVQAVWREEVEEVLSVLRAAGVRPHDLEESRFLKSLPQRSSWVENWCSGEPQRPRLEPPDYPIAGLPAAQKLSPSASDTTVGGAGPLIQETAILAKGRAPARPFAEGKGRRLP